MDIIVTGFAGFEGSLLIYKNEEYRKKLLDRYSKGFFAVFENDSEAQSSDNVSKTQSTNFDKLFEKAKSEGWAEDAADGGVLSALWRLLKANRSGGCYSQKDIPVLQQTIEICEMFSLNPYRLHAPGCRVWLTEDTGAFLHEAAGAGMPLSVIGYTFKGAAIKRTDTEGDSSLRRPEGDELDKMTEGDSSLKRPEGDEPDKMIKR